MRWATCRMGTVTHVSQPGGRRVAIRSRVAASSRRFAQVRVATKGLLFLPDTKHRGRKQGGSVPPHPPELCFPLPGVSMPRGPMFSAVG